MKSSHNPPAELSNGYTGHSEADRSSSEDREELAGKEEKEKETDTSQEAQIDNEVVLVGQVITAGHHKILQLLSYLMILVSLLAFIFAVIFKVTPQKWLFRKPIVQQVNMIFAAVNVGLLGIVMTIFITTTIRVNMSNLTWTRRKKIIATIAFAQVLTQFINSIFFLIPNAHGKFRPCSWFHKFQFICATVRWTCWNTFFLLMAIHTHNICPWLDKNGQFRRGRIRKGSDQEGALIIMDAVSWIHLPKIVFWCLFEFLIIFLAAYKDYDYKVVPVSKSHRRIPCELRAYECKPGVEYKVLTSLWVIFIILYVCMIQTYILQARRRLLLGRYNEFLQVHLMALRQRKAVWSITILGVIIVPVLWYTRWDRCNNYFVAWLGLLPLQVVATSVTCLNAYYFMPLPPHKKAIQQAWLQKFAWDEASCKEAKLMRSADREKSVAVQLDKEPMFCFETAVKLALWSEVVYTYGIEMPEAKAQDDTKEETCGKCCPCLPSRAMHPQKSTDSTKYVPDHIAITLDEAVELNQKPCLNSAKSHDKIAMLSHAELMKTAMKMYELEQCEVMAEDLLQTRALLSWSGSTLVVAFRGTATMANIVSDAKAWRSPHPPVRGTWILGRQPLVHKGFLQTWTVNGFNVRILKRIKEIYDQRTVPAEEFIIRFTGHSLGGSLSHLAAIEAQRTYNFPNLFVYTYGAPRTGNHAFCRELDSLVPEHWQLINDRDAVPRTGKFYVLYKRAGQRVLLNQIGDIRVRPSVIELSIHRSGYSVKQHLMASYVSALFSVCMAQCMQFKCEPGGREGVEKLAQSKELQAYFSTIGLDLKGSVMGEKDVILPTLKRKHAKSFNWCGVTCFEAIFSALEDLVPGLEEENPLGALLSGDYRASKTAHDAAHETENQAAPEQLLNRISASLGSMSAPKQFELRRSMQGQSLKSEAYEIHRASRHNSLNA